MTHKIRIMAGDTITSAIAESIALAKTKNSIIEFDFNGVTVQVASDSDPELIHRDWNRGMLRDGGFVVSPYPEPELSFPDAREDERLIAERDKRMADARAAYEAEKATKTAALTSQIDATGLDVVDAATWQAFITNNDDPYGAACVRYADAWGRLMQTRIEGGAALADIADECSHKADTEGITGFMYGCAVSMLAQCWKHGEELRRWHNLKTQIGSEGEKANESGGVLNPAVMNISA